MPVPDGKEKDSTPLEDRIKPAVVRLAIGQKIQAVKKRLNRKRKQKD